MLLIYLNNVQLINKTISEELINQWIKKCRPELECEKKDRIQLELSMKLIEQGLKKKKGMVYPDDQDSHDMLFPHEFLFLMCNTKNRLDIIGRMPKPEFTTAKKSIKRYEMQPLDAIRLDKVYQVDMKFFHKAGSFNP